MSLTEEDLKQLAEDVENYRVERKASLASKTKIEEAVCAFANDLPGSGLPGYLLVGVRDDGTPSGLTIDDQLLQNLASIRSDGYILPFPRLTVQRMKLDGEDVAVVEVFPSRNTPLRLRGRVCVRVGPRRDTATRDEERTLVERRRAWDGPFDQSPVHGATLDDLDLELFRTELLPSAVDVETLAANERSLPEQLTSLHLASPDAVPNVAGLLLLGREPTGFIKGAYVQFLRFDGTELTDPMADRREIVGPLPTVLRQMDDLARSHIRVRTQVAGRDREANLRDYPLDALQQLLRNAVMHRNYETSNAPIQWYWFSDRVEIHNPGGLFGRASPEMFGKPGGNDYRNPTLAAGLHALGYVQRFGFGVPLARKACRDNGNPEPEFSFQPGNFSVIMREA